MAEETTTDNKGGQEANLIAVKIDGEDKQVTLEQLKANYQKGESADAKFQQASELSKKAEGALALQSAVETLNSDPGSESAFRVVAGAQGWNEEKIVGALKEYKTALTKEAVREAMGESGQNTDGDDDDGETTGDGSNESQSSGGSDVPIDQLAVKVAEILGPFLQKNLKISAQNLEPRLRRAVMEVVGKNLTGTLQEGVDSDEYLGKLVKMGSETQVTVLKNLITEEAKRRAATGDDPHSPTVQKAILQTVRGQLEALGVRPAKAPVPSPGLGSSGSGLDELYQEKPVERLRDGNADPKFAENLASRLIQAVQADRANTQS